MVNPSTGEQRSVAPEAVEEAKRIGFRPESEGEAIVQGSRDRRMSDLDNPAGQVLAGAAGLARTVTGGASDVLLRGLGGGEFFSDVREAHPLVSGAAEIGGALLPVGVAGYASKLGQKLGATAEGASLGEKVVAGAKGYGAEGAIQGFGQGVSELALSDDPLTAERIASVLTSNTLLGGGIGAGVGTIGKVAESGLLKAKGKLDEIASGARVGSDVTGDLAALDAKGLRAAEKAELDVIEKARVPERAKLADEIAGLRKDMKEQKTWLATKGSGSKAAAPVAEAPGMSWREFSAGKMSEYMKSEGGHAGAMRRLGEEWKAYKAGTPRPAPAVSGAWEGASTELRREISEIGKVSLEADRSLDRILRNPKALASRPQRALDALQQQESALERLAAQKDNLASVFAKDASGERMAALGAAEKALERNRALQEKIAGLTAAPSSERLAAIADARDALSTGGKSAGIGEKMASGAAYSGAAHLAASIPVVGPFIAPFVGNAAASAIGGKLSGKLAKGVAETAERTSKVISKFLDVGAPVARAAPVLATKVLGAVRYSDAPEPKPARGTKPEKPRDQLAANYHARSEELRSQTTFGPEGKSVMRPEARMKMADRLDPVRHISPILADRLETIAARRVQFLADKLPRRPDLVAIKTGPDRWQPSDMQMRQFARYAAAVEDPSGIEERLVAGSVTPEDAEVMREVYPERYAAIQAEIAARLPELRGTLPYQRRLALSVFSGVPVDPAMHPRILAVLQSSFAEEPGSEGGTQAPKPAPQFGSIKNQEATPAQARQGATT